MGRAAVELLHRGLEGSVFFTITKQKAKRKKKKEKEKNAKSELSSLTGFLFIHFSVSYASILHPIGPGQSYPCPRGVNRYPFVEKLHCINSSKFSLININVSVDTSCHKLKV